MVRVADWTNEVHKNRRCAFSILTTEPILRNGAFGGALTGDPLSEGELLDGVKGGTAGKAPERFLAGGAGRD